MNKLLSTVMLLSVVLFAACTAPDKWELVSKDSHVRFVLENRADGGKTSLSYSVYYRDTLAVENSLLGLVMDCTEYGTAAHFVSASPVKEINDAYQLKAGKRMNTVDDCR